MNLVRPGAEELASVRADPLLWEQELDVRPEVAEAVEHATGIRAGRAFWRSEHDHLYGLELADLGRGRPSMAMVYGHWDRYEPGPPSALTNVPSQRPSQCAGFCASTCSTFSLLPG